MPRQRHPSQTQEAIRLSPQSRFPKQPSKMDHGLQMLWSIKKLFAVFLDRAGSLSLSFKQHRPAKVDAGEGGVSEKRPLKFRQRLEVSRLLRTSLTLN